MKDFFKTMFACLAALTLAAGGMLFVGLVFLGALIAAGGAKPIVQKGSILVFDLALNLTEAPTSDSGDEVLAEAFGTGAPARLQVRKVVDALRRAAKDDRIAAVYLHGSLQPQDYGSGYGAVLEVRAALEAFRASGKPVIAYLVAPSHRDYLLASAAGRVAINPLGMLMTPGLSAEVVYYGGAFKRFGIGVQIARAGLYKSAGETWSDDHMSPREREQLTALLDDVWGEFIAQVARSRGLDKTALQNDVDRFGLFSAGQALQCRLVDAVADFPSILGELRAITGDAAGATTFKQVSLRDYIGDAEPPKGTTPRGARIAVVYVEGLIVDGEGTPRMAGGDRLARELRAIGRDDGVKALVLRVNSPGGSAIASEVIRREVAALHGKMPVVVSMGSVAASGGYWVSTACDKIYAQPATIAGSIGVIALLPDFEELAGRFSLAVERVQTGRNAGIFSVMKARSPEAMAILQAHVDDIYGRFLDRVAECRKMDRAVVETVAGGRVWSGADALALGLVDAIGGLEDAIADAAARAGLQDYAVSDHPAPRGFMEDLLGRLSGRGAPLAGSATGIREVDSRLAQAREWIGAFNDPAAAYARLPYALEID
jgi:protease-4